MTKITYPPRGEFSEDMGEISGFGGGYEEVCRTMLKRGVEWLDAHPNADLKYSSYKNVFGLVNEESPDAEELSKIITKDLDCTGAMHHAVTQHLYFIKNNSWEKYCDELRARSKND